MRKSVLFITGTRADFGKLKPLISRVAATESFDYRIFATGMHMLSRYGATVTEITKSGFQNIYPYLNQDPFGSTGMDLALANTIQGLGHYVREFSADLIVVRGTELKPSRAQQSGRCRTFWWRMLKAAKFPARWMNSCDTPSANFRTFTSWRTRKRGTGWFKWGSSPTRFS